jgi:hypothetical protein
VIYFARVGDDGPIKIGRTVDLKARMSQHHYDYGIALRVLGVMPGADIEERAIHRRFSKWRLNHWPTAGRVELFEAVAEILDFIASECVDPGCIHETPQRKNVPVRLSDEAIKWARIASGYTGESMAEYVSRIVAEHAKVDADRLHAEITKQFKPKR